MIQGLPPGTSTVVLVRFSSIGDLLLAEPLPRLLKKVGVRRVVFVTKENLAPLPQGWPAVDRTLCLSAQGGLRQLVDLRRELLRERADLVLDLHNNQRSRLLCCGLSARHLSKHRLHKLLLVHARTLCHRHPRPVSERYLQLAGLDVSTADALPQLWTQGQRLQYGTAQYEVLVPGAGLVTKCWPREHWIEFTRLLLQRSPLPLLILGGNSEAGLGRELAALNPARITSHCGTQDLNGTARLLAQGRRLICGDTGLMHMADAARIPGVVLFGGTVPELGFAPRGGTLRVIQRELGCRPCSHIGRRRCPRGTFKLHAGASSRRSA